MSRFANEVAAADKDLAEWSQMMSESDNSITNLGRSLTSNEGRKQILLAAADVASSFLPITPQGIATNVFQGFMAAGDDPEKSFLDRINEGAAFSRARFGDAFSYGTNELTGTMNFFGQTKAFMLGNTAGILSQTVNNFFEGDLSWESFQEEWSQARDWGNYDPGEGLSLGQAFVSTAANFSKAVLSPLVHMTGQEEFNKEARAWGVGLLSTDFNMFNPEDRATFDSGFQKYASGTVDAFSEIVLSPENLVPWSLPVKGMRLINGAVKEAADFNILTRTIAGESTKYTDEFTEFAGRDAGYAYQRLKNNWRNDSPFSLDAVSYLLGETKTADDVARVFAAVEYGSARAASELASKYSTLQLPLDALNQGGYIARKAKAGTNTDAVIQDEFYNKVIDEHLATMETDNFVQGLLDAGFRSPDALPGVRVNGRVLTPGGVVTGAIGRKSAVIRSRLLQDGDDGYWFQRASSNHPLVQRVVRGAIYAGARGVMLKSRNIIHLDSSDNLMTERFASSLSEINVKTGNAFADEGLYQDYVTRFRNARSVNERQRIIDEANEAGFLAIARKNGLEEDVARKVFSDYSVKRNAYNWSRRKRGFATMFDGTIIHDPMMKRVGDTAELYDWNLLNQAFRDFNSNLWNVADKVGRTTYTIATALNNFFITTILLRPARIIRERFMDALGVVGSGLASDIWLNSDIIHAPGRIASNMLQRGKRTVDRVRYSGRYGRGSYEDSAAEYAENMAAINLSDGFDKQGFDILRARLKDPSLDPEERLRINEILEEGSVDIYMRGEPTGLPERLDDSRWLTATDNDEDALAYAFAPHETVDVASVSQRAVAEDEFAGQWLPRHSAATRRIQKERAQADADANSAWEDLQDSQEWSATTLQEFNVALDADFDSLDDAASLVTRATSGEGSANDFLGQIEVRRNQEALAAVEAQQKRTAAQVSVQQAEQNAKQIVNDFNADYGTSFGSLDELQAFLIRALSDTKSKPSYLKRIESSDIRLELAEALGRKTKGIRANRENLRAADINVNLEQRFPTIAEAKSFLREVQAGGWLDKASSANTALKSANSSRAAADVAVDRAARSWNPQQKSALLARINTKLNTNFGSLEEAEAFLRKVKDGGWKNRLDETVKTVAEKTKTLETRRKKVQSINARQEAELAAIQERTGIAFASIDEAADFLRIGNEGTLATRQKLVEAVRRGDTVYELRNGKWRPVESDFTSRRSVGDATIAKAQYKIVPQGATPSRVKIEAYGEKASLGSWEELPEGLAAYMGWTSRADYENFIDLRLWETDLRLKDWADANDFGKVVVPDDRAISGVTVLVSPRKTVREGYQPPRAKRDTDPIRQATDDELLREHRNEILNRAARNRREARDLANTKLDPTTDVDLIISYLRQSKALKARLRSESVTANRRASLVAKRAAENNRPLKRRGQEDVTVVGYEFEGAAAGIEGMRYADMASPKETYDALAQASKNFASAMSRPTEVRSLSPSNPEYFDGWAGILAEWRVNGVADPLVKRLASGETDEQIIAWIRNTREGRAYADDVGIGRKYESIDPQAQAAVVGNRNPANLERMSYEEYVSTMRMNVDNHLPTPEIKQRFLSNEEITATDLRDEFGEIADALPTIEGVVATAKGRRAKSYNLQNAARAVLRVIDEMPQSATANHPMYVAAVNRARKRLVLQAQDAKGAGLTNAELKRIDSAARKEAVRVVKDFTYNIQATSRANEVLRLGVPFISAYTYTMKVIYKSLRDNPAETLWGAYQVGKGLEAMPWVDEDGNPTNFLNASHAVLANVSPEQADFLRKIPFVGAAIVDGTQIRLSRRSMDVFFGGELFPSVGPTVAIPLAEVVRKNPGAYNNAITKVVLEWALPMGAKENALDFIGSPVIANTIDKTFQTDDYMRIFAKVTASEWARYRHGLRQDKPTEDDIRSRVNAIYDFESGSFFFLPIATRVAQDYQIATQKYASYVEAYGDEATFRFTADHPELMEMWSSVYDNPYGVDSSAESVAKIQRHRELIGRAAAMSDGKGRDMIGFILDPSGRETYANDEYDQGDRAARTWLTQNAPSDMVDTPFLEQLSPAEYMEKAEASSGWSRWRKAMNTLQAIAIERGTTIEDDKELAWHKAQIKFMLGQENPAWRQAYGEVDAAAYNDRARILNEVLSDEGWARDNANAPIVNAIAVFLEMRSDIQSEIAARGFSAGNTTLSANPELRAFYLSAVHQLKTESPQFAEFYDRYFDGDTVI